MSMMPVSHVRVNFSAIPRHFLTMSLVAVALASLMPMSALADDPYFRVLPIGDPTGLELGRGIDIITGAPRADCVEGTVDDFHVGFMYVI
jgi:hypothetical protein